MDFGEWQGGVLFVLLALVGEELEGLRFKAFTSKASGLRFDLDTHRSIQAAVNIRA